MPGVGLGVFPLMSGHDLGIFLVSEESGSLCPLTILDQFSGGMGVEFWVDGSNYDVPRAVYSSDHA